jgi:hypothetical protein
MTLLNINFPKVLQCLQVLSWLNGLIILIVIYIFLVIVYQVGLTSIRPVFYITPKLPHVILLLLYSIFTFNLLDKKVPPLKDFLLLVFLHFP